MVLQLSPAEQMMEAINNLRFEYDMAVMNYEMVNSSGATVHQYHNLKATVNTYIQSAEASFELGDYERSKSAIVEARAKIKELKAFLKNA